MGDDVKPASPEPPGPVQPPTAAVPTPRRPRRWVLVLAALALFASGGVVGSAATVWGLRRAVLRGIHNPRQMPEVLAARLRSRLGLSVEQEARVREVLQHRQEALLGLRREVQPRLEAELDRVRAEVAEVLDDQQRRKWHERFDEMRGRWLPPAPPAPPALELPAGTR